MRSALASFLLAGLAATAACGDDPAPPRPLAASDVAETDEDTAVLIDVLANDAPAGDGPLTVRSGSTATGGHGVSVENNRLRFEPARDFNGVVVVTYVVREGDLTATGRVQIIVHPVNDAPIAAGSVAATRHDQPVTIALGGTDPDEDPLTYEVLDGPSRGTLTGTGPLRTYTPGLSSVGRDTISFRVRDGVLTSAPATITITVVGSAPPVGQNTAQQTAEDTAVSLQLRATDPDSPTLTYAIVGTPDHGTVTGTGAVRTYTPAPDFNGSDRVRFSVTDGSSIAFGEISITVTARNDAPRAISSVVAATEDLDAAVTLQGTDIDSTSLTYEIAAFPTRGTVTGFGANRTYRSNPNVHGADSFTFRVGDGLTWSEPATVTINVASAEDAPVATNAFPIVTEDVARAITLAGTDGDGDPLTYALVATPTHGGLTDTAPALTYTPAANYNGTDSFTFSVSDGDQVATGTISITVTPVNDGPTAANLTITVLEDVPTQIVLVGQDIDSPTLTYSSGTTPSRGTLTGTGATRIYTPNRDVNGADSFIYSVSDGTSAGGGTVSITVTPVNDAPRLRDDDGFVAPGATVTLDPLANDRDIEGDTFELTTASAPAHGTIEIDGDELRYTAAADFTGTDTFTYTVTDAPGATSTATVRIGAGEYPAGVPIAAVGSVGTLGTATGPLYAVSADGRHVAFLSTSTTLVAGDTNGVADVFVLDRVTGEIVRVSVSSTGAQANGASERPTLSANGRIVAFASAATNLVAGDDNNAADVFVRDLDAGTTIRASVATGGAQAHGRSSDPALSDDGTTLAFLSLGFDLVGNDVNGARDAFVRDLAAGTTRRVNVTSLGGEADLAASAVAISGDGRRVAFVTRAANLVAGDTAGFDDVFVHDLATSTTERISVSSNGVEANGASSLPSLSRDGRFVAFLSAATNLALDSNQPGLKTFVRDRQAATTINGFPAGSPNPGFVSVSISADARYLAIHVLNGACVIRDRFSDQSHAVARHDGPDVYWPILSRNGRYVIVVSAAALVPDEPADGTQMFAAPNPL